MCNDGSRYVREGHTPIQVIGIDLAVHSLKDLQTEQPPGLTIGAVCKREKPNDVLISRHGRSLDELPRGAKVATGSLRRRSQLLNYRPDLEIVDIRGNVQTRLRKFEESRIDGMILAYAGLHRLGLDDRISEIISTDVLVPAVGQGSIAVEIREGDSRIAEVANKLDHAETRACITAERAFLRRLEGGCQVPIGGFATLENGMLTLNGVVGSLDGKKVFRDRRSATAEDAAQLGDSVAAALLAAGADSVLEESRITAN